MSKIDSKIEAPKNNKLLGCFSHKSDHWRTPSHIYVKFMMDGFIDPCPFMCEENNLDKLYHGKKIFINPPYSDIKSWVEFIRNNLEDNYIVLLIPARTDTKYFHELLELNPEITFIKGRLHFNDSKNSAPFPSIFLTFGKYKKTGTN